MKKIFLLCLIVISFFIIVLPSSHIYAAADSHYYTEEEILAIQDKVGAFEAVMSEFFLDVGDYAQTYINTVFKEEITIDKIVYNRAVLLNANFFEKGANPSRANASTILREVITKWYEYFRKITLVVILICLILVGIRFFLQTPQSKIQARDILKKVVMAIALVYFFPYVMRYAFDINEAIIQYIGSKYSTQDRITAVAISEITDAARENLEYRSPQYISLEGLRIGSGTSEATRLYLNKIEEYKSKVDVMRLMRAFGGVTLRFTYIMIWWIMLAQTYILAIVYIKRYILIAFLIIIYPLVVLGYVLGGTFGQRQTAFNKWCGKFFTNVFMQTLHAIMYGIISGIVMNQVLRQFQNNEMDKLNVILLIIATSFLFSGEKLLTKFWKLSIDDSERKGLKGVFGKPRKIMGQIKGPN